jgi:Na+-transporting NADH:ubiquinone oxidoreductase subunit NqrC
MGIDKTGKKRVREEEDSRPNKRIKTDDTSRRGKLRDRDQKVLDKAGIKDLRAFARAGKTKTKRQDRMKRVGIVTKEVIDTDRAKTVAKKEKKDQKKVSQQKKKDAKLKDAPKKEEKKKPEERRRNKTTTSGFKSQKKFKRR